MFILVPEAPPLDVSCIPLSAVSVKVSWRPPPVPQHGGLIQGYKVLYTPQLRDHGTLIIFILYKPHPSHNHKPFLQNNYYAEEKTKLTLH